MSIFTDQIIERVQLLQDQAIEAHNQWARLDPYEAGDYSPFLWACVVMSELPDLIAAECLLLSEAPETQSTGHFCEKIRLSVVALAMEMRVA